MLVWRSASGKSTVARAHGTTGYRIEKALAFVDESGRFQTGEHEVGVLAMLLVPADHRKDLASLVDELRDQVPADPSGRKVVKGSLLDDAQYHRIADTIRKRWLPAWCHAPVPTRARDRVSSLHARWKHLRFGVGRLRARLPRAASAHALDVIPSPSTLTIEVGPGFREGQDSKA